MKVLIFAVAESLLLFTVRSMGYPLLGWVYEGVAVGLLSDTSDAS